LDGVTRASRKDAIMSADRHPQVLNLRDVKPTEFTHGAKFGGTRKRLAATTGSKEIGCSWFEIPPGRQNFPHHYHFGNEEAFFVLSGSGSLRLGDARIPIEAGDYIACPPGSGSAHAIVNTGTEPLRYLGISTAHATDVVVYADSKKFSAVGGADMHKGLKAAPFFKIVKDQPDVDYFLDEE